MPGNGQEKVSMVLPILISVILVSVGTIIYYSYGDNADESNLDGVEQPDLAAEEENPAENAAATMDSEVEDELSECLTGIPHQDDWCYINVAVEHRVDVCDDIIQSDFRNFCNAVISNDQSYCEEIGSQSLEQSCFERV